ncbi:MAG: endo-1,4-beta-xylanase [Clostridia bacterium]|nr:endo-1,4-beta-xylanase [Clostridia bacterium]
MTKRILSFVMALLLVVGTLVAVPMGAKAEGTEKTYTFSELDSPMEYGLTSEVKSDGTLAITFQDQYKSKFFKIPDDIDPSTITKVTFKVTKGDEADLAFKLHDQADYDSDNKEGTPVSYGKAEVIPSAGKAIKYFSIMSLNGGNTDAEIASVTFDVSGEGSGSSEEAAIEGENIIPNGNFADADTSMWTAESGTAKITTGVSDTPIFDDVTTYGIINDRTRPYDCFGMDITNLVTNGSTYAFSFYAMLSDEYEGAPSDQRQVGLAPYVTSGGSTTYLGSYSAELRGDVSQQLTPGKWTKFQGTFKVAAAGNLDQVVIRLLEQGTNYGEGDCVKGEYYVTGVSLIDMNIASGSIEKAIPSLRDVAEADFGADFIMGTSITGSEINDQVLLDLVKKHFNAITLGNELKPDAMFGYSNNVCPGTVEAELNGEKIRVPKVDFSRAEKMLDYIKNWNDENPDKQIKVRGHVLTWHSQTPEWFFHEDYDAKEPYVSVEEMNKRHEWYIKTVLEHFVGEDSPYKDMFYGWDVVNEAVSDSTGTYRSDKENSSWWAVYKSNEFINNAFVFANKYAPESLELYYNDYNDCTPSKVKGIVELLKSVKATEGARIDGMGMQGHYDIDYPTMDAFEESARAYGEVVGTIMLTELDLKSQVYDGTEATLNIEYTKQAYKYKAIYDSLKKLNEEGIVKPTGMTVWGVIDGNSWLQAYTGVGGGVTDGSPQCPLLFDDDYHAKPAFWAIADPTQLSPEVKMATIMQSTVDNFDMADEMVIGEDKATAKAIWNPGQLQFKVDVKDSTDDASDAVVLYLDKYNSKSEGIKTKKIEIARADGETTADGYSVVINVELEEVESYSSVGFDIVVVDGEEMTPFNDTSLKQESSSKFFADGVLKACMFIPKGTAKIDGEMDDAWANAAEVSLDIVSDSPEATATVKVMWDDEYLYTYATVIDPVLNKEAEEEHQQDSLEVFIDETNSKAGEYNKATKQYRINYANECSFNGETCTQDNVNSFAKETENGYVIEAAFKWTEVTPSVDSVIGIELQVNDANATKARVGNINWSDATNQSWSVPANFGIAMLVAEGEAVVVNKDASGDAKVESEEGSSRAVVGSTIGAVALLGIVAASTRLKKKNEAKASEDSENTEESDNKEE